MNEQITKQLEEAGFDYAVAIATNAEVEAGAACGQLAIIDEEQHMNHTHPKQTGRNE